MNINIIIAIAIFIGSLLAYIWWANGRIDRLNETITGLEQKIAVQEKIQEDLTNRINVIASAQEEANKQLTLVRANKAKSSTIINSLKNSYAGDAAETDIRKATDDLMNALRNAAK